MEHTLVELAPSRHQEMPAAAPAPPDRGRERRPSRSPRWSASAVRPSGHRRQDARHRAEMREFEAALARWVR